MENQDSRFSGKFIINDEEKIGNLIYNKENGVICLFIDNKLSSEEPFGKTPQNIEVIYGEITSGHKVTLLDCEVVSHSTKAFLYSRVRYEVKFLIWGEHFDKSFKFNSIILKTTNLLEWSNLRGISADFDNKSSSLINHCFKEAKKIELEDYTIIFKTVFRSDLFSYPIPEKAITEEHLIITIESIKDISIKDLVIIKNLVLDFISFSIRNNVEISEMKLNSNNKKLALSSLKASLRNIIFVQKAI